jgi:hypothetical protein
MNPRDDRRARWLIAGSAAVGIGLAAFGVATSGQEAAPTPAGAVALVNGEPISREALARFVGAVAADRTGVVVDAAERRSLLQRLLDEELLLQRALALGLPRHEPVARRAILSALVDAITAEAEGEALDEEALRRFWSEHPEAFAGPGEVAVDLARFPVGARAEATAYRDAAAWAERARAGEDFAAAPAAGAEGPVALAGGARVPFEVAANELGPTAARVLQGLTPGGVSDPIRGPDGYLVLRLRERVSGGPAPFESVRDRVRQEVAREANERAVERYVQDLRATAEIRILDPELAEADAR